MDLLPTLLSWAPTRVILLGVTCANRMRLISVQKQRKALFFDQRVETPVLYNSCFPEQARGRVALEGPVCGGRGQSSCPLAAQACCTWCARLKCQAEHFYPWPAATVLNCSMASRASARGLPS